jgi:preprotein translocase subunit YajC
MQEFALFALVALLALGAYWSLVIFPKQRDFTKRQRYVQSLDEGAEVVTYGGIIGRVVKVEAEQGVVHVEIAKGVIVRLITAAIVQPYDPEVFAQAARAGMEGEAEQPSKS